MLINYIILAIFSAGMLIWAYRHVPGTGNSSGRDEGDGGLPVGGDSYPSDDPPSFSVSPEEAPEDKPASSIST